MSEYQGPERRTRTSRGRRAEDAPQVEPVVNPLIPVLLVVLIVLQVAIAAAGVVILGEQQDDRERAVREAAENDREIVRAQIAACEIGREGIQTLVETDITNLREVDASIFPGVSPQTFEALREQRLEELREVSRSLDPARCESLFEAAHDRAR